MSAHKLHIEMGRHTRTPREHRVCKLCAERDDVLVVEDELHVFECPAYADIRIECGFAAPACDVDESVRALMNVGGTLDQWRGFATYLMRVFEARANV